MATHMVMHTAAALLVATLLSAQARPPVRDGQRPTTGTAVLAGMVVSHDRDARPLRRA